MVAHLALHRLFADRGRPVPGFLMLDQPSQSQYPADPEEGQGSPPKDEDRLAVTALFQMLDTVARELNGRFQIIVVDHVDFKEDWFQNAVRERWRHGEKLVPESWID